MKIKSISYVLPPKDLIDDTLDVMIFLEDQDSNDEIYYGVEVTTPQCLSSLIEESGSSFLPPAYPYIIVSKLTDEIIRAAIQSFIDTEKDLYWLKLYHTTPTLNIEDIDEILYRKKQESIELDAKIDAEMEAKMEPESDINH